MLSFVKGASPWIQVPANALLGPIVAVLSFVCSIGNVPMAVVLWGAGVSFGGVLAFLYADLIVLDGAWSAATATCATAGTRTARAKPSDVA